jgi:predicted phage terminase large subunit-like protein
MTNSATPDPVAASRLSDALCRTNLLPFVRKVFRLLHPDGTEPFIMNWHIDAMCHALEQTALGNDTRLILEVPPRHLKSVCTSVALPAWLLGRNPAMKILVASYGAELADEHARNTRAVMTSDFYKRLFPNTVLTVDRSGEFKTTRGGMRKGVSVGGATTGFGADIIIIDDLIKADAAHSEAEVKRVQDYLSSTLITRLNNPVTSKILVIQQRLSEMDPAGFLKAKGGYKVLSLPSIASRHETIPLGQGRTFVRAPGDLLFPQRFPEDVLERLRRDMGSSKFSAQHLQNPTPPEGNLLRMEWFKTYDFELERERFSYVVQSWDTGQSSSSTSDFSVCTTWGLKGDLWHLIHVYRDRVEYRNLLKQALYLHGRWQPDKILVEKAANGFALLDDLRGPENKLRSEVRAITPKLTKPERFNAAAAQIENGKFALPIEAPWLEDFIRECLAFPNSTHDDQADSMSQFVDWQKKSLSQASIHRQPPAVVSSRRSIGRLVDYSIPLY